MLSEVRNRLQATDAEVNHRHHARHGGTSLCFHRHRLWSTQLNAAFGWELDAKAALIIGGTSLFGWVGIIGGTIVWAFIICVLSNGLNLMGVPSYYQQVIKGLVFILAITVDLIYKRRR